MNLSVQRSALLGAILTALTAPASAQYVTGVVDWDSTTMNTAIGYDSMPDVGTYNTATGVHTLSSNTSGTNNSAFGAWALYTSTGSFNTAVGALALNENNQGYDNSALGYQALGVNTSGGYNTSIGNSSSNANVSGSYNTAIGLNALYNNTDGSYNIAVGNNAGLSLTSGSNDIYIGSTGGAAMEEDHIRIGTKGVHRAAFLQGVYKSSLTTDSPVAVYVNSAGQLGVLPSSKRFKTDVAGMGEATARLGELRPVSFRLKDDPSGRVHYGLIAEEVATVYPELVVVGEDGKVSGVRYEQLAPMLLNEVQRQQLEIATLKRQLADVQDLKRQLTALQRKIAKGNLAPADSSARTGL